MKEENLLTSLSARNKAEPLWTPPDSSATTPLALSNGKSARTIVDVWEAHANHPEGVRQLVHSGKLPVWVRSRGQQALADRLEQLRQSQDLDSQLPAVLLQAAACEVQHLITTADARSKQQQEKVAQEHTARQNAERKALLAALAKQQQATANQVAADKKHVAAVELAKENNKRKECARRDAAINDARQHAAEPIAKGEAHRQKARDENRGLRGAIELEIPLLAVSAGGLAFVGFLLSLRSTNLSALWCTAVGVGFGALLALAIGRLVRSRCMAEASKELIAAQVTLKEEINRITEQSNEVLMKVDQWAAQRSKEANARLKAVEAEREHINNQALQRIAAIQQELEKAIANIAKSFSEESESLRKRLTSRISAKPEDTKSQYPPYSAARSAGFKYGTEPSRSECQMTYSEESEARQQLMFRG